ncbi:phosphoglycerate kinase [Candidatus Kaiserbacteria bacterium RIFCSPLOWO2_02_FULL_54_13]|uniref:Phosphoglycerate kinase n=1 Tax=Candidatus Kaiserbacteria bacterium RIFCSPHIGHO2_02_FULL_54_22 TaxID=1798495 RepID=A0A1F6DL28_9BACT|nr:MAG: Phosphoglycerate kinase [Parcubacteria group bacterium GW2011_GWB1_55_9]OGG62037.1 MAG: phosphoglycerate kinase [Candidatus Kaiserbacteria bacterium RIFCSPHIGHO2_02_FULL_54_22]OGG68634.1 MAG: phosphoglycerate kinase [Candidatus Kaiserbacteria bacterium RIFCSPHIGHO2_12_FULL_54_16]OGG82924.1 MAG: phosphoglycerate kinase [Candidatus Kaiserbacteria bacterium RIFCSPLOWO2_02_FULL_54_13]
MRSIRDIPITENIPILVRAALNVPVVNGKVTSDYRLRRALPTIQYLRERGARIILISHITGRGTETFAPVAQALGTLVLGVSFCPETVGARARAMIRELAPREILVLENLRRNRGERVNDVAFTRELAALGDVFVQDSFDECHRSYASIVGVPKFLPSYAGLLLEEEVAKLARSLAPKHPALAVIAGAKFGTKEPVLTTLLKTYDHVFVGGALASDFLKASGQEVGKSLVSDTDQAHIKKILSHPRLVIPTDSLVVPASAAGVSGARAQARVASLEQVRPDEVILDSGPDTLAFLAELAREAKTILWNGPLGKYEDGFVDATNGFARAVAASGAYSVVGGGDTVAAIESLGLLSRFSFVSTGGGAMLEFLARGTLPGIDALESHASA